MANDSMKPTSAPANDDEMVQDDLAHNARRALAMKLGAPKPARPESLTSGLGMKSLPNAATTHELSLESEGVKPVMQPTKEGKRKVTGSIPVAPTIKSIT